MHVRSIKKAELQLEKGCQQTDSRVFQVRGGNETAIVERRKIDVFGIAVRPV